MIEGNDPIKLIWRDLGVESQGVSYEDFKSKFSASPEVRAIVHHDLGLEKGGVSLDAFEESLGFKKKVDTETPGPVSAATQKASGAGSKDSLSSYGSAASLAPSNAPLKNSDAPADVQKPIFESPIVRKGEIADKDKSDIQTFLNNQPQKATAADADVNGFTKKLDELRTVNTTKNILNQPATDPAARDQQLAAAARKQQQIEVAQQEHDSLREQTRNAEAYLASNTKDALLQTEDERKKEIDFLKQKGYSDTAIQEAVQINEEKQFNRKADKKTAELYNDAASYFTKQLGDKGTPESVKKLATEKISRDARQFGVGMMDSNQKAAYTDLQALTKLMQQEVDNPGDDALAVQISDLKKSIGEKLDNPKMWYDPVSGKNIEQPTPAAQKYRQEVAKEADNLKSKNTQEKLADNYFNKYARFKYVSELYDKSQQTLTLPFQFNIAASDDEKNFAIHQADRLKELYIKSKTDFDAASQAYLLNRDPSGVPRDYGLKEAGQIFLDEVMPPSLFPKGMFQGTDKMFLESIKPQAQSAGIELTKSQEDRFKKTLTEEVVEGVGGIAGIIPKLYLAGEVVGLGEAALGVRGMLANLSKGSAVDRLTAHLIKGSLEEVKTQVAGFNSGVGAGYYIAGGVKIPKLAGKFGAIAQPYVEKAVQGSVGATTGMEMGEVISKSVDALSFNQDWKTKMNELFPSVSETGHRIMTELLMNSVFGLIHLPMDKGAFMINPEKLRSLSDELRSKGYIEEADQVQKKADEIRGYSLMSRQEIDKTIAQKGGKPETEQKTPASQQADAQKAVMYADLTPADFEGKQVDYNGIQGTLVREKDGYYVQSPDGHWTLVEGGESGKPVSELGIVLKEDVVEPVSTGGGELKSQEVKLEGQPYDGTEKPDEASPLYDKSSNEVNIYGKKYQFAGFESNSKGDETAIRVIDDTGKLKFIRNQGAILDMFIATEVAKPTENKIKPEVKEEVPADEEKIPAIKEEVPTDESLINSPINSETDGKETTRGQEGLLVPPAEDSGTTPAPVSEDKVENPIATEAPTEEIEGRGPTPESIIEAHAITDQNIEKAQKVYDEAQAARLSYIKENGYPIGHDAEFDKLVSKKVEAEDRLNQVKLAKENLLPLPETTTKENSVTSPINNKDNETTTNERGNSETGIPEKDGSENKKSANKGIGKGRVKKVNRKIKDKNYLAAINADPASAYDQVLQHFISGGKITSEVVQSVFGSNKKKVAGEKRARIGITNNSTGAKTVDSLAHFLWENQFMEGQYDSVDFRDAILDVLHSHNNTGTMVSEFLENNRIEKSKEEEYWRGQITEKEREDIDIFNMTENYWDDLTNEQREKLTDENHDAFIEEQILTEQNQPITDATPLPELTEKEKASKQIADGLEGILSKIGAIKKISEDKRTTLLEDLKNLAEGTAKQFGLTLKEVIDDIISKLRYSGKYDLNDGDIAFIKRGLLGKEPVTESEKPKQREKSVNVHAIEGGESQEIKNAIRDLGIKYDVQEVVPSKEYAKDFYNKFGREKSLAAIREHQIEEMPAAFLWGEIIDGALREVKAEKDPQKRKILESRLANFIDDFGKQGRAGGRFNKAIDDVYKSSEFSYMVGTLLSRAHEIVGDKTLPASEREALTTMSDELEKLKGRISEHEQKVKELELQRQVDRLAADVAKRELKSKSTAATAKKAADYFRKLKNKPIKLLDENGNEIQLHTMGFTWNDVVEGVAVSIEKIGNVIEGIEKYLDKQKWYKELTDQGRLAVQKQLLEHFSKEKEVAEAAKEPAQKEPDPIVIDENGIEIPYSLIKKLVTEGVKDAQDLVDQIHELIVGEHPEVTKRQISDAISKYGQQKFPSEDTVKQEIAKHKRTLQLTSALLDALSGKRPLKSGFQKPKPEDEHRRMMRQIKDLLKSFPEDPVEKAKTYATAQDRIRTALDNRQKDLNKQIANNARDPRNTKETVYSDANKELKNEVEWLEQVLDNKVGEKEIPHEDKVDRAIKFMQESISDIQHKIDKKELDYKKRNVPLSDPILTAMREVKKGKLEILKQMREAEGIAMKRRLELFKQRIAKDNQRMTDQLASGNIALPKTREELTMDAEGKKMVVEKMALKEQMDTVLEKLKLNNRTSKERILDHVADVLNIPRTLMASFDLSAALRQGAILSVRHPLMAADAFKKQFEFAWSQKAFDDYNRAIKTSPDYYDMQKAGLYLTFESPKLSAKEEQFMSNIAHKIPIIGETLRIPKTNTKIPGLDLGRRSERAYTGYLNKLRVDVFQDFKKTLEQDGLSGKELEKELKSFAGFINQATGRGNLGKKLNQAAPILNSAFFAPRFVASRFNLLGKTLSLGYTMTPKARVEFQKTMGAYIGMGMTVLALAALAGYEVDGDPTSSDFGKIRDGNTTHDIWAGLQQEVVLMMRMMPRFMGGGVVKNTTTKERVPLDVQGGNNEQTRGKVLWNFVQSKYSPPANIVKEAINQENAYDKKFLGYTLAKKGEKPDIMSSVLSNISPIWPSDIPDIYNERGLPNAAVAGAESFFGVGVQNYQPNVNAKIQREISDAIKAKDNPELTKGDINDEVSAIRNKYQNDPEYSDANFDEAEKAAWVLHKLKDKPDWYKDIFYSQDNKSKVKMILENTNTKEERQKVVDEMVKLEVISKSVKHQVLEDKVYEQAEKVLKEQNFENRQMRQEMESVYDDIVSSKDGSVPDTITDIEMNKLKDIAKKRSLDDETELVLKMQVGNMTRAKYILSRTEEMSDEQATAYLQGLYDRKAMTTTVINQYEALKAEEQEKKIQQKNVQN